MPDFTTYLETAAMSEARLDSGRRGREGAALVGGVATSGGAERGGGAGERAAHPGRYWRGAYCLLRLERKSSWWSRHGDKLCTWWLWNRHLKYAQVLSCPPLGDSCGVLWRFQYLFTFQFWPNNVLFAQQTSNLTTFSALKTFGFCHFPLRNIFIVIWKVGQTLH